MADLDPGRGPDGPGAERLLAALDPEQRTVATTLTGPVAVLAGAGTGKTRAITHRIAYGTAVGAYPPNSVLAVTFTTRAAGELRGRLRTLGAAAVQARTFHSAALRQAQYFWPKVTGTALPPVAENRMGLVAEAASRLRLGGDTARLRDLLGEVSWAKVSNVSPEEYPAVAAARGREVSGLEAAAVARVLTGYEELKRERARIDFDDILLCTVSLLADHPEVADAVRRTYRHVVVDEYQDVSPLQESLLRLWVGERDDLCVVGDPAQTIHSFAGARADFLTGFAARHPGTTVVRLVRDYRSTPQVVEVANRVMAAARPGDGGPSAEGAGRLEAVTLRAQRPSGPAAEMTVADDEAGEAEAVARWLQRQHEAGVEWREMAVLFRVNAQSPAYEAALADRGVPYLVRGAERFYERAEVRQALGVLRAAARAPAVDHPLDGDGGEASVLRQVRDVLAGTGWTPEPPTGAGAARERWESVQALSGVAEDVVGAGAGATLADVVAELEQRAAAQHAPIAHGVTVSTLHAAKGLEWDAVALVGVQEGTVPFVLARSPAEVEEERRLLYVGITRARERLRISWARSRSSGGTGNRAPSRFLAPVLPPTPTTAPAAPARPRADRRSSLAATCRACSGRLHDAAERTLGRHHDCPSSYDEHTLERLREWRRQQAEEQKVPAYCIFTEATLVAIAERRPSSSAELVAINGLGRVKVDRYGEQVLRLVGGTGPDGGAEKKSEVVG